MIKTVIRLRNNLVMVFNEEGEQVPEYQGQYENVKGMILSDSSEETLFNHWYGYSFEPKTMPAEKW